MEGLGEGPGGGLWKGICTRVTKAPPPCTRTALPRCAHGPVCMCLRVQVQQDASTAGWVVCWCRAVIATKLLRFSSRHLSVHRAAGCIRWTVIRRHRLIQQVSGDSQRHTQRLAQRLSSFISAAVGIREAIPQNRSAKLPCHCLSPLLTLHPGPTLTPQPSQPVLTLPWLGLSIHAGHT